MSSPLRFLPRLLFPAGYPPLQLILFVTGRCNARCGHCFYAGQLERGHPGPSLEQYAALARSSGPLLWLSMTGGEPFLREDLPEIARLFVRRAGVRQLTIPTNGLATGRIVEDTRRILELHRGLNLVVYLSIDGPAELHDELRGVPGCYERARETWAELKQLKRSHRRLNLATITTICHANHRRLPAVFELLLRDFAPDDVVLNMLRGVPADELQADFELAGFAAFQKMKEAALREGRLPHFSFNPLDVLAAKERYQWRLILELLKRRRQIVPCLGGALSGVVAEDGHLYPCETLMAQPGQDPLQREHFCENSPAALGNLHDVGWNLPALWWSKRARHIRRRISQGHCWCTYECAWTTSLLFNPRLWWPMITGRPRPVDLPGRLGRPGRGRVLSKKDRTG